MPSGNKSPISQKRSKRQVNSSIIFNETEINDTLEETGGDVNELLLQAELLNGLTTNKFNQLFSNLHNQQHKVKLSKIAKNAKQQKEMSIDLMGLIKSKQN